MKKILLFLCLIATGSRTLQAAGTDLSTLRLLIVGGAVAGAELVYGLIRFLSPAEKQEEMKPSKEEELKKQEELKKLLAPSKLLEMVNETNNAPRSNTLPSSNFLASSNQSGSPDLLPAGMQKEFTVLYVTNTQTQEIYEFRKGRIDYYEVAMAYYRVGKQDKAREFLLKTIAMNYKRESAISFLTIRYGMSTKEISREVKKYSEQ